MKNNKSISILVVALVVVSVAGIALAGTGMVAPVEARAPGELAEPTPTAEQGSCAPMEPPPLLEPELENEVREVAQQALDAYNSKRAENGKLEIMSVRGEEDWAVVECVPDLAGQPDAGTEGVPMLLIRSAEGWQAALPGDASYTAWLARVPDLYMAPTIKEEMQQLNLISPELIDPSVGIYRLPYPDGASVEISWDSDQHGGPVDMRSANGAVVAAMGGWVDGFYDDHWECCCDSQCRLCNNWITLRHPGGEYTEYHHIAQNSVQVSVGEWVSAGTVIATQGDVGMSCGMGRAETACGPFNQDNPEKDCAIHVHFAVRTSDGTVRKPRFCDGQGGWFYPESGYTYTAQDCPGNCCCSSREAACTTSQSDVDTPFDSFFTAASDSATTPYAEPTDPPEIAVTPESTETEESDVLQAFAIAHEPVEPQRSPPTSANYQIARSVFGSSGGAKASTNYVMNSTQGQATDLSRRQSASYVLMPGYWSRWIPSTFGEGVYLPLVVKGH